MTKQRMHEWAWPNMLIWAKWTQWRSQDLEVEVQGVWGTEVPQRGPGAEPLVGGSGGHSLPKAHSNY